jgi:hypothetical protein
MRMGIFYIGAIKFAGITSIVVYVSSSFLCSTFILSSLAKLAMIWIQFHVEDSQCFGRDAILLDII